MPGYDGTWVLGQLKEKGIKVPVIMVTSDVQTTTRDLCMSLGAFEYLNKPVLKNLLQATIGKALTGGTI